MGSCSRSKIYGSIDILFHPTTRESFGRVYIEAMKASIPVVAVNAGGGKELIESGRTGFKVSPDCPREAAAQIKKLSNNLELYNTITKNAYEYVTKNFDDEKNWLKLYKCYETCLKHAS